jgi:hypothetical protein
LAGPAVSSGGGSVIDDSLSGCDLVDINDFLDNIEKDIPAELVNIYNDLRNDRKVSNRDKEKILVYFKTIYN